FSEPESRAVRDLVLKLRPQVSIWFHQPWGRVLAPCHGPIPLQRTYSRISGVPLQRCRAEHLPGTAINFANARIAGSTAFVVELPGGSLPDHAARANARAVEAVVKQGRVGKPRPKPKPKPTPTLASVKPPIKDMLIPYPAKRKHEMAHYSKLHYG